MSTEIQTTDTSVPEGPMASPASVVEAHAAAAPSTFAEQRVWRQRRYQIGAGILALIVILGLVGNNVIARQYTPDGAVRQFLTALQSGDASAAWSEIQVSVPAQSAAVTLTDEASLRAALATARPDLKSFDVTGATSTDASTAIVNFSYETSSGSKHGKFIVQRSGEKRFAFYPVWSLVIKPTLLQITLPKGSDGITFDGKALAIPDGKSTIAVLPLAHKLQFNGTQMLAVQTIAVDAFLASGQSVAYQPKLTAAGVDKAKNAIKAYFDNCAKLTSANPDPGTCPQSISSYLPKSGHWQLIGDPTQDLTVVVDKDLNVAGVGHYQMAFAYPGSSQGTNHVASGGGYSAAIVLAATDLAVANIQPLDGLPALTRPSAATDQAAKDLVGKAMAQCATVQAENVADCPQSAPDAGISSVNWNLTGDPLAGATVSFDQKTGLFTVHANFAMSVSYTWFGNRRSGSSYITAYNAHLFWDGQGLQLVNIDGAAS